ncbi:MULTISPECIES: HAD family hydrolase [unclassified Rhodococcus (in: high G+C Gram-positive bacteria)]|uniref:HAD family hydrolase n=1 Tax=unclassified Rhodococcus (in: high G+C Gram-positive bacteria) TaxID=192944 RepID=UPI0006F59AC1|nr:MULTISPECIES: HAD family hydrolase [unclassified Rhodococcus (in: high G+C Gram-positive bacteria)]KQU28062.1 HAD family hydrolase [Rhodococcus sp. Leaf225]KQU46172.1 HAD family hydrolase [Rhodococcus sp. Leaf258]
MTSPAVLFDIDGTLVDSNYAHVHAWARAFSDAGIAVDSWRIHRSIGMDGVKLLSSLAGDAPEGAAERAKELHTQYYEEMSSLLSPLPGALDLLGAVADRGLQVVLATSAPENELAILRGLLGVEEIVSELTSSEDVETAKPEPRIVDIALDRAGVGAERAVFVGDSVWDVKASVTAGVPCIGVRSGGVSSAELTEAGATAVYDDPADLLAHIDSSMIARLG